MLSVTPRVAQVGTRSSAFALKCPWCRPAKTSGWRVWGVEVESCPETPWLEGVGCGGGVLP